MLTGREFARESALARDGVSGDRGVGELGAKESRFCLCVSRPSGLFLCSTLGSWLAFGDGVARSCFSESSDAEVGERWPPHWDMNDRTAARAVRTGSDARDYSRRRLCSSTQRLPALQRLPQVWFGIWTYHDCEACCMLCHVQLSILLVPTSIVFFVQCTVAKLAGGKRLLSGNQAALCCSFCWPQLSRVNDQKLSCCVRRATTSRRRSRERVNDVQVLQTTKVNSRAREMRGCLALVVLGPTAMISWKLAC